MIDLPSASKSASAAEAGDVGRPPKGLAREVAADLERRIEAVWNLGVNFVVAWRPAKEGIVVLHLPCYALSAAVAVVPDLLTRGHRIRSDDDCRRLVAAGCAVETIALPHALGNDETTARAVDKIMRRFTVRRSDCRAVALFDIVNFSLSSTYDQIAQINFLSHCINLAAAHCRAIGFDLDLHSSTTGDGFYIWNRNEGFVADQALYFVAAMALAANNSVKRDEKMARGVPTLRCCVGFGSHFEYRQAGGGEDAENVFIVGDVTINLARLIAMTLPDQVLIANHVRELGVDDEKLRHALGADTVDTATFIALSQGIIGRAVGMRLPTGVSMSRITAYLTGEQVDERELTIRKYAVTDKHGIEHRCFNLKFNVRDGTGKDIYVGLLDGDLADFRARHVEDEDIRIRLA